MEVKPHKDLKVWQEAMSFVVDVYSMTKEFPKDEVFGLTSQMRRAAVSVASNITEGAGRRGAIEFSRFIKIALGSVAELETQIEIAFRIGYISTARDQNERLRFIRILLTRLFQSLQRK